MEGILWGSLLILVGWITFLSTRNRWDWYFNNWQARGFRQQLGDSGFITYSYLCCVALFVVGLGMIGIGLKELLW